jgi:hydrogenase-1 operon protein HyaF
MRLPIFDEPEEAKSPLEAVLGELETMQPRGELQMPDGGPGSEEVYAVLAQALEGLRAAGDGSTSRVVWLKNLTPAALKLLEESLGQGEVSVHVHGKHAYDCVESVLPGLWRVRTTDSAGAAVSDHLEIAQIPAIVRAANESATSRDLSIGNPPAGSMNVLPLLAELRHRMNKPRNGEPNHVVNFTLFPMNEIDMGYLQERLGHGPVEAESRGYGRCRVALTGHHDIWSVQFFNAMGTVILDTLEVGDVPEALLAAAVDFEDSAVRLGELISGTQA